MNVFHAAFLAAPHWITEVNAGTLDPLDSCLKILRFSELDSSVCQDRTELYVVN